MDDKFYKKMLIKICEDFVKNNSYDFANYFKKFVSNLKRFNYEGDNFIIDMYRSNKKVIIEYEDKCITYSTIAVKTVKESDKNVE